MRSELPTEGGVDRVAGWLAWGEFELPQDEMKKPAPTRATATVREVLQPATSGT
jgi:hypothetical protein